MWEEEGLAKEVVAAMGPVAMDDGRLEHHWREKNVLNRRAADSTARGRQGVDAGSFFMARELP